MTQIKKILLGALTLLALLILFVSAYSAIQSGAQDEWQNLIAGGGRAMRLGQEKLAEEDNSHSAKSEAESKKPNEAELIASLQNLGLRCERTRRYDEAAKFYSRMAIIAQSSYGTDSLEYGEAMKALKRLLLKSSLLQKCPSFKIDENSYDKI